MDNELQKDLQSFEKFEGNEEKSKKELTFGQKAVGLNFNPSNDDNVGQAKQKFADVLDSIGDPTTDTERRSYLFNVIRTSAINTTMLAQMAVVKFITNV